MTDPERQQLIDWLGSARRHVLGTVDGLDDEALRSTVLPSGWSPLALVHHLATDVERFWFRAVAAGEKVDLPQGDEGWRVAPDLSAADVLELYRDETGRSDAVLAATPLDAPPRWFPTGSPDGSPRRSLREIAFHVLVETATHAGHLDAARELVDGAQWLVITDPS